MGQEEKPLSVRGERTKQWSPLLGQTIWTHVSREVSEPAIPDRGEGRTRALGDGTQETCVVLSAPRVRVHYNL